MKEIYKIKRERNDALLFHVVSPKLFCTDTRNFVINKQKIHVDTDY